METLVDGVYISRTELFFKKKKKCCAFVNVVNNFKWYFSGTFSSQCAALLSLWRHARKRGFQFLWLLWLLLLPFFFFFFHSPFALSSPDTHPKHPPSTNTVCLKGDSLVTYVLYIININKNPEEERTIISIPKHNYVWWTKPTNVKRKNWQK